MTDHSSTRRDGAMQIDPRQCSAGSRDKSPSKTTLDCTKSVPASRYFVFFSIVVIGCLTDLATKS